MAGKKQKSKKRQPVIRRNEMFSGRIVRPSYDPPVFNKTPWFRVTLQFEDAYQAGYAYQLTPKNIRSRLGNQFGIPVNAMPELIFSLRSVFVWAIADAQSKSVSLELDVSSLVPSVSDDASPTAPRSVYYGNNVKLIDCGTLNKPAAVGYHYSASDRAMKMSTEQQMTLLQYAAGGNGYLRMHLHVALCFAGVSPPFTPPTILEAGGADSIFY